jgi:hypothetical protein
MDPIDDAPAVDRALKELPTPRAPRTLLPRVLAAIAQPVTRPWYARSWFTWPQAWQVVSVAVLVVLFVGLSAWLPRLQDTVGSYATNLIDRATGQIAGVARTADATATLARILWRVSLQPIVEWIFALVLLMSLACAAFRAALTRLAPRGALSR